MLLGEKERLQGPGKDGYSSSLPSLRPCQNALSLWLKHTAKSRRQQTNEEGAQATNSEKKKSQCLLLEKWLATWIHHQKDAEKHRNGLLFTYATLCRDPRSISKPASLTPTVTPYSGTGYFHYSRTKRRLRAVAQMLRPSAPRFEPGYRFALNHSMTQTLSQVRKTSLF